jgi:hypothetical protein
MAAHTIVIGKRTQSWTESESVESEMSPLQQSSVASWMIGGTHPDLRVEIEIRSGHVERC